MSKYEKICAEISRLEEKIRQLTDELKAQKARKTELENVEIIGALRETYVSSEELMAFLEELKERKAQKMKESNGDEKNT